MIEPDFLHNQGPSDSDFGNLYDIDDVLAAVRQNGLALKYASANLQGNYDHVLAAVRQNGLALKYASANLQGNQDIVLAAVQKNGLALEFASPELQGNQDIVLTAVQQNDDALKFALDCLQLNHKFILAAVKSSPTVLIKVKAKLEKSFDRLLDDMPFVLSLLDENPACFQFLPRHFRVNPDVVRTAVMKDVTNWEFVINSVFLEKDFMIELLRKKGGLIYTSPIVASDKEMVLAAIYHNRDEYNCLSIELQSDPEIKLAAAAI